MSGKPTIHDVLRLSGELERELMEARSARLRTRRGSGRVHTRHVFPPNSRVVIADYGATISEGYLAVPFDISSSGMGLLHGRYIHPGSRCRVMLRRRDGEACALVARVVRCSLLRGRAHEVGLLFEEPVDPAGFVELDELVSEAESDRPLIDAVIGLMQRAESGAELTALRIAARQLLSLIDERLEEIAETNPAQPDAAPPPQQQAVPEPTGDDAAPGETGMAA